jgi:translation initiation factor IF-2
MTQENKSCCEINEQEELPDNIIARANVTHPKIEKTNFVGCTVSGGTIFNDALVQVVRDNTVVKEGLKIKQLTRWNGTPATEIMSGTECKIEFDKSFEIKSDDVLAFYYPEEKPGGARTDEIIGRALVKQIIDSKDGKIASCFMASGIGKKDSWVLIMRDSLCFRKDLKIKSMKVFNMDVDCVVDGVFALEIEDFDNCKVKDVIEFY